MAATVRGAKKSRVTKSESELNALRAESADLRAELERWKATAEEWKAYADFYRAGWHEAARKGRKTRATFAHRLQDAANHWLQVQPGLSLKEAVTRAARYVLTHDVSGTPLDGKAGRKTAPSAKSLEAKLSVNAVRDYLSTYRKARRAAKGEGKS